MMWASCDISSTDKGASFAHASTTKMAGSPSCSLYTRPYAVSAYACRTTQERGAAPRENTARAARVRMKLSSSARPRS